jgi:hypothetical protein
MMHDAESGRVNLPHGKHHCQLHAKTSLHQLIGGRAHVMAAPHFQAGLPCFFEVEIDSDSATTLRRYSPLIFNYNKPTGTTTFERINQELQTSQSHQSTSDNSSSLTCKTFPNATVAKIDSNGSQQKHQS